MTHKELPRLAAASVLTLGLCSATLLAQQNTNPPSGANPATSDASGEDDLIVLSPFVVDSEGDKGYQATSTLAGTRIRTDLRDVGSAISVVTDKFMKDIGATNNETLLTYTTNTEVGGVKGNFGGVGSGRELNESTPLLRPSGNTRVRGLTAADNTRDYFLTDIPWDGYNVSRVDMQRGPNAILFGMGSPAGIINNSTNQAAFKSEGKVEARFDSESGIRGTLDLNRVILKDELALRVAGMAEHLKYRQKPAFSKDDRQFSAVRYEPKALQRNGMKTSIRASYETGEGNSNRPRNLPPTDNITAWWTQMGKAVYDPLQAWTGTGERQSRVSGGPNNGQLNPNFNPWLADYGGIFGNVVARYNTGGGNQVSFGNMEANGYWGIGQGNAVDGSLMNEARANGYYGIGAPGAWDKGIGGIPFARQVGVGRYAGWASVVPNPKNPEIQGLDEAAIGAFRDRSISDSQLFDFYNNLLDGENKREWRGFEASNFAVAQTFLDNRLGVEAVHDRQRYNDGQTYGVRQNLYLDINTNGLDGVTNPNVGQAFVQHNNGGREYSSESEASRFTGFADVRATDFIDRGVLASILGRHVVTGMYADEKKDTRSLDFLEYAMDPKFMFEVTGADVNGNKLNNRGPVIVSYLSGDLRGTTSASQANLRPVIGGRVPAPQNGTVYRFDSHWAKPTDPSAVGYIDPSAEWIAADGGVSTQAENPANYRGWGSYPVNQLLSYDKGDKASLYTNGISSYRQVKSQAFVWQAYLFDGVFVPTVGWRRDEFKGGNQQAPRNQFDQVTNPNWVMETADLPEQAGESISSSFVLHTPRRIRAKLPYDTGLSLFFNRSENFQPRPGEIDMFGDPLANPSGKTKDYGFVLSTFDDKLNFKMNWYQTDVTNDRLSGFEFWRIPGTVSTLLSSASRVRNKRTCRQARTGAGTTRNGRAAKRWRTMARKRCLRRTTIIPSFGIL